MPSVNRRLRKGVPLKGFVDHRCLGLISKLPAFLDGRPLLRVLELTYQEAAAWVQLWKRHDVRPSTVAHVDLALEIDARFQVAYFDALIPAAARLAGCATVFSEDLQDG